MLVSIDEEARSRSKVAIALSSMFDSRSMSRGSWQHFLESKTSFLLAISLKGGSLCDVGVANAVGMTEDSYLIAFTQRDSQA